MNLATTLLNYPVHLQISDSLQKSSVSIQKIETIATMKLTASFLPLVFASLAASTSLFSSGQTILVDDDLNVPGENPLKFCQNPDRYTLTISGVDLTPNPPLPSVP